MAARDVPEGVGHGQHRQPERQRDPHQTDPHGGDTGGQDGAATSAEHQPERSKRFSEHPSGQRHGNSRSGVWRAEARCDESLVTSAPDGPRRPDRRGQPSPEVGPPRCSLDRIPPTDRLRWSDLDPNGHVRHSVYYDWAATVRLAYLEQQRCRSGLDDHQRHRPRAVSGRGEVPRRSCVLATRWTWTCGSRPRRWTAANGAYGTGSCGGMRRPPYRGGRSVARRARAQDCHPARATGPGVRRVPPRGRLHRPAQQDDIAHE